LPFGDRRDQLGGAPQPLYRFNSFEELDVVTASGVGGGSLVYSNVSIRPHFEGGVCPVMENWPLQLTETDYDSAETFMSTYRGKPSQVVTKFPITTDFKDRLNDPHNDDERFSYLGKCRYLKEASEKLAADAGFTAKYEILHKWAPLTLAIIEYPDPQPSLDKKAYCERQGRCFLGCLPGARHTLNKSIINKLLYPGGAPAIELRSLAEVTTFEKIPGGWKVKYEDLRFGDHDSGRKKEVTTEVLVLAAGCLSTNELMLRAQNNGLTLSRMMGHQFSTNGDFAGFIDYPRDLNDETKFNPRPWGIYATRGPINASHVMFRKGKIQVNFEDASVPPMVAPFVRAAIDVAERAQSDRQALFDNLVGFWKLSFQDFNERPDTRIPENYMTEAEQLEHTFFFNLMGRDQSPGTLSLDGNNKLNLTFEGGPLHADPVYAQMEEIIQAMATAMNGKYIRFPFWGNGKILSNDPDPARKFVTVHPLGGCQMGVNSSNGVVNTKGQVFDTLAATGTVHDGLYIADASVIPGPLAVNPTLTIVAMTQKIAAGIP
jgi:cholesterol oxidase